MPPTSMLHPVWKNAVARFLSHGFLPGTIVSYDWLYQEFCLDRPTDGTTNAVAMKAELEFLTAFKRFEGALLVDHNIALKNIRRHGYEIVCAEDQTRWAFREGMKEVAVGLRRMTGRLVYIDQSRLTSDMKKQNADAVARGTLLQVMLQRQRRLPK